MPGVAPAADYYAFPGSNTATTGCTSTSTNATTGCTLQQAIVAARAPGPDVVHLAAGTFASTSPSGLDTIVATDPQDTDLTIVGAGRGATVVAPAATDEAMSFGPATPSPAGSVEIRDLSVKVPASAGPTASAIVSNLASLTLRNVGIDIAPNASGSGIRRASGR